MYIEPNSEVYLMSGVGLDTTQRNTIYFESKSKQIAYFKSKVIESFPKVSYQRVNRGYFRCGINAERIYTCNYMMFRNTAFGDKWFYAFVTKVEYINDMTTQVEFVIDPVQTYWFDIELKQSFVEREHSATDTYSDWMISEDLPTGKMEYDQPKKSGLFDTWVAMMCVPYDDLGEPSESGHNYNGLTTPINLIAFSDKEQLNAFIKKLDDLGKSDSIISISMIPEMLLTTKGVGTRNSIIPEIPQGKPSSFSVRKPSGKIGSYEPKNGKLLSYPYSFLTLSNSSGAKLELRWELFTQDLSNPFCTFNVYSDFINGNFLCVPVNYCGTDPVQTSVTGDTNVNFNFGLGMGGCPQVPWISDTFKIYMAQNKVTMLSNATTSVGELAVGVASGNPILTASGAMSTFNNVTNDILGMDRASRQNDVVHGGGGNNAMFDSGFFDYFTSHTHVTPEVAKVIDDYFTMYGYQTNRVKVPNINVRPHWTFTKTVGCNLRGNAPSDDLKAIKDIFDNGVTFWKNGDEIGNYALDNSV